MSLIRTIDQFRAYVKANYSSKLESFAPDLRTAERQRVRPLLGPALYNELSALSDADLQQRASTLGLDAATFKTCLASTKHDEKIRASQKAGESVEVRGTPAFFINGRFLNGAMSKSAFAQVIDDELSRVASN